MKEEESGSRKSKGIGSESSRENEASIVGRLVRIEDSLRNESWLPLSLRAFLATELPQVKSLARKGGRAWRPKLAKQVLMLALASWAYGPSPLQSQTVSQLRSLDLELNASVEFVSGDSEDSDEPV